MAHTSVLAQTQAPACGASMTLVLFFPFAGAPLANCVFHIPYTHRHQRYRRVKPLLHSNLVCIVNEFLTRDAWQFLLHNYAQSTLQVDLRTLWARDHSCGNTVTYRPSAETGWSA